MYPEQRRELAVRETRQTLERLMKSVDKALILNYMVANYVKPEEVEQKIIEIQGYLERTAPSETEKTEAVSPEEGAKDVIGGGIR